MTALDPADVRWDPASGLVPAVVQDARDGRVLMLAWMDAEALAATVATGEVHFHSRSRDRLWRKGETSGHVLRLIELGLDCDGDAILVRVEAHGPTCHQGTRSCFDRATAPGPAGDLARAGEPAHPPATPSQGFAWLETLWATIVDRKAARPPDSYTARLLDGGADAVARKVSEEATEVLLAAKDDTLAEASGADRGPSQAALAAETADLVYHALVLLAERDLAPGEVVRVLQGRQRT